MNKEAVRHTGTYPDIYLKDRSTIVVTLRVARQQISSCRIIYFFRTVPDEKKHTEMHCVFRDSLFDYYQAEISLGEVARYQKYYFEITERNTKWYYSTHGLRSVPPEHNYFEFLYANSTGIVKLPEWSKGAVYYQIFPERFCRGPSSNNVVDYEEWGTLPTVDNYMGGNLKGIIDRLDYLEWLGVDCIYLNPIFSADFNHKYATNDYFEIDKMFGDTETFHHLVEDVHRRKMRIILDGVFNHTGIHFWQFQDILNLQEKSSYTNWYHIKKYPVEVSADCYECVGDYKYMPKLNTGNPQVREFILRVMEYWIEEFHIDGWRLDVADEVDESVWLQARIKLKEKYPQSILLGETWGSGLRLMDGLKMDCIMNYTFRDAICDFLAYGIIDAKEFDGRLQAMLASYPETMNQAMFLPLDSHDTERFLYCCDERYESLKLAVIFQMTFVGAPSIYYGDEVGLTGANDPDCRRCMVWDPEKQNQELLQLYRKLIMLRRQKQCIKTGEYAANLCEGRMYGFVRFDVKQEVYTIINADDRRKTADVPVFYRKKYIDWESGREYQVEPIGEQQYLNSDIWNYRGRIQINMEPMSAIILLSKEE